MKVSAIIPAAGLGVRLGEEKQFKLLAGYPLFIHSIRTFINFPKIDEIVVVVPKNKKKTIKKQISQKSKIAKKWYYLKSRKNDFPN